MPVPSTRIDDRRHAPCPTAGRARRAWLARATFGVAGLLGLTGCEAPPRRPLVYVANDWAPYLLLEAADAPPTTPQRFQVAEMPTSSDSLLALRTGTADAAGLTLDEVLLARQQGLALTVVAVCNESSGADMLLGHPDLGSVEALRGRRVGAERTAVGALVVDAALRQAGVEASDVRLIDLPLPRQMGAWQRGEVDAVVSFGATALALRAAGAKVLFDSSAMPGAIVDVIAVRGVALQTRSDAVRDLLRMHFDGLQAWQARRPAARERLARRLGVQADVVEAIFGGITLSPLERQSAWLAGGRLTGVATQLARAMQRHGLLERDVPLDGLSDARLLPPIGG